MTFEKSFMQSLMLIFVCPMLFVSFGLYQLDSGQPHSEIFQVFP